MSIEATYTVTACNSKAGNLKLRAHIFRRFFIDFIRHAIGENFSGSLVEIGAGMGHKLHVIQETFPKATCLGIEPSEAMRTKSHVPMQEGSLTHTNLADQSQDVVFLLQMWHHIPPEEYEKALGELRRILRPGGKIILLDTFLPEGDDGAIKELIFQIGTQFYNVLSQFPVQSLLKRFGHALMSICTPDEYPLERFRYFSPIFSTTNRAFHDGGFHCIDSFHWGIAEMFVFELCTSNSSQTL